VREHGIDQSCGNTTPVPQLSYGEIETMTSGTGNVHYDGSGHLVLTALHSGSDPGSGWTSGRVETQPPRSAPPPRWSASSPSSSSPT